MDAIPDRKRTFVAGEVGGPASKRGEETRQRILDEAEQLFAARGFDSVTVRQITTAAGVDLALVNYHFGSKRELFHAVFDRRAGILNKARLESLDGCLAEARDGVPTVEAVIEAFLRPLLDKRLRPGPGWKAYFALVAQVNSSPHWGGLLMSETFDPVIRRFIDALRLVFPGSNDADLYWSYHFLSGALSLTFAETGRLDQLSDGAASSSDWDAALERMVPYVAAGFRRVCSGDG